MSLSVGIGGLSAMVQLPAAIDQQGSAVLTGFVMAFLLLAVPAYLAELTSWRLHGGSLLVTMFDGMRAGRVRISWALGGIFLVLVLGMLATLAAFSAGIIAQVGTQLIAVEFGSLEIQYDWLHPVNMLFWPALILGLLLPELRAPGAGQLRRAADIGMSVFYVLAVGVGLYWAIQFTPASLTSPSTGYGGIFLGMSLGVMASLMGLGVMHTAVGRYADRFPAQGDSAGLGLVLLVGVAVLLWIYALIGWGRWLREDALTPTAGLGFFVSMLPALDIPRLLKMAICAASVLVLLRTTVLLLDVVVVWLTTRFPRIGRGTTIAVVSGVALLTGLLDIAVDESIDAQTQMPLVRVIPVLASTLLPLVALVMMSMFTRSLPPGPMIWAQRVPMPLAAALYIYWRYPLRLFLLILLLYSSGIGQFLLDFWIPHTYA